MTNKIALLVLAASLGVPYPNIARIKMPRLNPATWIAVGRSVCFEGNRR